jgi:hypothetical protein
VATYGLALTPHGRSAFPEVIVMPDPTAPVDEQLVREAHEPGRLDGVFASTFERRCGY